MPSTTKSVEPAPKLRVTYLSWTLLSPHCAHALSAEVDSDDEELAVVTELDDDFTGRAFERGTLDDVLGFTARTVALALDDLPCEDDVLEVKDGEVVIIKFIRCMGGNDVAQRAYQTTKLNDRHLGHVRVYGRRSAAEFSPTNAPIQTPP